MKQTGKSIYVCLFLKGRVVLIGGLAKLRKEAERKCLERAGNLPHQSFDLSHPRVGAHMARWLTHLGVPHADARGHCRQVGVELLKMTDTAGMAVTPSFFGVHYDENGLPLYGGYVG